MEHIHLTLGKKKKVIHFVHICFKFNLQGMVSHYGVQVEEQQHGKKKGRRQAQKEIKRRRAEC